MFAQRKVSKKWFIHAAELYRVIQRVLTTKQKVFERLSEKSLCQKIFGGDMHEKVRQQEKVRQILHVHQEVLNLGLKKTTLLMLLCEGVGLVVVKKNQVVLKRAEFLLLQCCQFK